MSQRSKSTGKSDLEARQGLFLTSSAFFIVPAGAAIIALAVFLTYLPSVDGGFILDDDDLLTGNPLIKAPDGLYQFWCTSMPTDYWPASSTTLWTEWRLWEMNPAGYHVSNMLLHIVEALLVWLVLRKLSVPGAFLAAVIFAVHPVNVESVAWIASRKNLTAMLFLLLSILWYLKTCMPTASASMAPRPATSEGMAPGLHARGKRGHGTGLIPYPSSLIPHPPSLACWYWLSLGAFVLAMLGKGSVAFLPLVLLGIIWWLARLTWQNAVGTAPFFAVAAVLAGINVWFQTHGTPTVIRSVDFTQRLLGAAGAVWFYLYKAILPLDLAFIYPRWLIQNGNILYWLALAAALVVTALLLWYRNSWGRPLAFAWGFFCAALIPVMGFTDVGFMKNSLVADRYQHIAIIAVIALAAAGFGVWRRCKRSATSWQSVVAAAAVIALAVLTWQQNGIYRDKFTLYHAALEKNPGCWLAENNLGLAYDETGRHQEAAKHYENAVTIKPDYALAHSNLGACLVQIGRPAEAAGHCRRALEINPDDPQTHYNLGNALKALGRIQEAIDHYQTALQLSPNYSVAHNNLGTALKALGRYQEAITHFEKAIELDPQFFQARINLGSTLLDIAQPQEAIRVYREALELKPDLADAHVNLALALAQTGQAREAIEHCRKALAIKPGYSDAYHNMGIAFYTLGRPQEAIQCYRQAMQTRPGDPLINYNMGNALKALKQYPEAIERYQEALRLKPDFPLAHNNLAVALADTGRLDEAIEHYRQALRLKPDYVEAHSNLGFALAKTGRVQEAIDHYREAIRIKPDFGGAYFNLALACAAAGQSANALAAARKGLDLARSQGQTALAKQIEGWLNSYRASSPDQPAAPPAAK